MAAIGWLASVPFPALPPLAQLELYEANHQLPARRLQQAHGADTGAAASDLDAFAQGFLYSSGLERSRPPLAPGKSGESGYRVVPFQLLSWHPRIAFMPSFLDPERCDRIINFTKAKGMSKSPVSAEPGGKFADQDTRTSTGAFVWSAEDPNGDLQYLEDKIAAVTLLPVSHGEPFNMLHYEPGQVFEAHMDAFDADGAFKNNNQRLATVITYLNDVEEGGETSFMWEGEGGVNRQVKDWRNCDDSPFKIKPRKGDAILFYSLDPDLKINHHSLHGSCPVKKGEKWVATKWISERPFVLNITDSPAAASAAENANT